MKRTLTLLSGTAIAMLLTTGAALAGTVDESLDPQIFVQDSGTAPAGGDPNIITNSASFVVGVAGNHTLQNPLLIIVGVYNGSGIPTLTFAPGVSAALVGTYGLTSNTATFNAASIGSAYDQVGLTSGGSESFVNWSAADVAAGFAAPTSFALDVFALNTGLSGGSPITIGESGAAAGSYIIAYSCEVGASTTPDCNPNGKIGETPFTNAGLLPGTPQPPTPTPEPGSLAIIGSGLLGLGLIRRIRKQA